MPGPKDPWVRLLAAGLLVGASLTACSQFSIYSQFQPLSVSGQSGAGSGTLTLKPGITGTLVGGNLYFTASGGTSPYTYSVLAGGAGGTITSAGAYTAPKSAGSDTVQVTDANGQVSNATVTVVTAAQLTISPATLQLNVGDSYTFTASGGVPPYSYSITSGGTYGSITSGGMFTASAAGTATVQVSDSLGNTATTAATVTVVTAGSGPLTLSPTSVLVPDNETLYLIASGGSGTYSSLTASKGSTQPVNSTTHTGSYNANGNLGNNTLTLTDSTSTSATAVVTVDPVAPSNLVASAVSSTEIDLTWTDNATATVNGINVYRAIGNGGFTLLTTTALASTATSYQDTGLSTGTVYVYKVVVYRNGSGGPFTGTSNYAIATTK